jgi:hypothetical protein
MIHIFLHYYFEFCSPTLQLALKCLATAPISCNNKTYGSDEYKLSRYIMGRTFHIYSGDTHYYK